jgi:hypothetical protein
MLMRIIGILVILACLPACEPVDDDSPKTVINEVTTVTCYYPTEKIVDVFKDSRTSIKRTSHQIRLTEGGGIIVHYWDSDIINDTAKYYYMGNCRAITSYEEVVVE